MKSFVCKAVYVVVSLVALSAILWFFFLREESPVATADNGGDNSVESFRHADGNPSRAGKRRSVRSQNTRQDEEHNESGTEDGIIASESADAAAEEPELTKVEQKLFDDIQEALDGEKAATVIELCKKIDFSSKRELREQVVAALGWFDGKTMAELTPFLADPDEDIASDALFQWQEALHEIESETVRASVVGQAMGILNDENALGQLAMELNTIDEKLAVDTLVQVIGGKNPAGVVAGKEAYEFITGEEYTTPEAANKWLQENYSPPED